MNLHEATLALVREERRLTGLVIENLQKISDSRLFLELGYSTLFEYCTRGLNYSEACAYRRIQAMRVAQILPEVKEKLDSGTLNLTTLAMAQSLISSANLGLEQKREVVARIENCSKTETERVLAEISAAAGISLAEKPTEKLRYISGDEADLHIRFKRETIDKLERIRSLRSHKNSNMSRAELIDDMCDFILKKIDPAQTKTHLSKIVVKNRRYISPRLRAQVWRRDNGHCTYRGDHKRCQSRHLLQIDHIKPLFLGGETTLQNLRLLCHAHHKDREREF